MNAEKCRLHFPSESSACKEKEVTKGEAEMSEGSEEAIVLLWGWDRLEHI